MWFRAKLKRSVWEGENQLYSRRRHRKLLHKKDSLRILLVSVTVMILLMVLTTQPIRLFNAYLSIPANIEPLIVEYRQTDLHSALQQSIMGHHNVLCADVAERQTNSREVLPIPPKFPVRMSFRMHCEDLFVNNIYGTGNVLLMLYNIRLIARLLGNVSIQMECVDAMETRSSLVIPWIMGSFPANVWPGPSASLEDACDSFQPKTAHIIVDDIQYELRRMAISLVGVPSINHPAANFTVKESKERTLQVPMTTAPLRSDVELDDVVIHFRCGDIIELKAHHKYHYVRWSVLAKRISPAARTIGIVTQPSQGQTRKIDNHNRDRCTQLLGPMQTYLQQRLPWAQVRIRNAPEETIALAFSRFIMANQSLAGGFSTFYRMPFYATFGTAYDYDEMGDNHMVSSELMMDLWQNETGLQRILSLFTSDED
ncbi:hypothetical protein FisN_10Lu173 [Fistulifera solaris]|uniref:Uncharacterized protein n=1 Tax=Fistulifera solaris TaxID=1519565 RepID=A0A1Z5JTP5_FISSO|nr:hypothetical protein FisN_10Lu173 [Fistulifera solaris]|eukprot:GAX17309.1 hypothetical protein FisN_10Lu173 [Fistulifera solaris]